MPKERNYNPVQAQRKADKARAIKKGKAEVQERRNERLARKNPARIQKHIDKLQAVAAGGGQLSRHEEQVLAGLQKELRAVGWAPPRRRPGPRAAGQAPARARRRAPHPHAARHAAADPPGRPGPVARAAAGPARAELPPETPPPETPPASVEARTVYEAQPVMRDLRREAVAAFVPAAVQIKMLKGRGGGGLLEPDEADRLEQEGYLPTSAPAARPDPGPGPASQRATVADAGEEGEAMGADDDGRL